MGKVFEDICCDYLWQHYDELPLVSYADMV